MNIPDFAKVLSAILHHNVDIARQGGTPRDYLVPMAWGNPGLGKTEIAENVTGELRDLGRDLVDPAEETGCWEIMYADLQTRDPADLGGMPWVQNGRAIRCRPDWLPTRGRGILFLDELPASGLANMNIAAMLIRDHRIGEHRLPPTWMIICAGNHQHNRAGTTTMPTHVRNRLLHFTIEADASVWATNWASKRGISPMVVAYNRYRANEFHHRFSPTENAFPSPRSWAMTDRVLRLGLPDRLEQECIAAAIGAPAGSDFDGFRQIHKTLPDPEAILANPDHGPLPDNPMIYYALMGALAYRATCTNFDRLIRYLDRLPEQEFSVICVLDAIARDEGLMLTQAYQRWAVRHGEFLSG